jgi:hypothetical protein
MRLPRFSIGRLMIVVGLIALNLAAGRVLFSIEPWLLIGVAPTGLALQFAVFRLILSRGPARAFWAGFLAAGLLAAWSLVGAMLFRTSVNVGINRTTGQRITFTTPGYRGADYAWAAWRNYLELVMNALARLPSTAGILQRDDAAEAIAGVVVAFLPQFLIALACGLLAWLGAWVAGTSQRRLESTAWGMAPTSGCIRRRIPS